MHRTCLTVCIIASIAFLPALGSQSAKPEKAVTPAAENPRDNEPGEVRDDNGLKMKLVWCPPGFLTMENIEVVTEPAAKKVKQPSDDGFDAIDEPALKPRETTKVTPVKVFLKKGYWLGKYEITQSEWKQVMQTQPWKGQDKTKEGADFPSTFVSWNDAVDFCHRLTEQERQAGRLPSDWEYTLPTEAQWERACRARTETRFSFGDDESKLGDYAWVRHNALNAGEQYAHPVRQKTANAWGLCDMHGNVWEWCRDIYTGKLPGGRDPEVKRDEKPGRSNQVIRGGSWGDGDGYCRSAFRLKDSPGDRNAILGFRVALITVPSVQ